MLVLILIRLLSVMISYHFLGFAMMVALAACGGARPYAALPIEDDAELVSNVVISDPDLYDAIRVGRSGVERVPGSDQLHFKFGSPKRCCMDWTRCTSVKNEAHVSP